MLTKSDGEVKEVIKVVYPKDVGLPAFNENTNNHDLALIKLSSRSALKPVPLIGASNKLAKPGTAATVIGWGLLEEGGGASNKLMQVTVPIISNDSCSAYYNLGGISLTDNMICAGINGKDSCQGDSGGGIFATDQQTGKDHIVGIVSFGIGCAQPEFPGVYTRVSNYTQWIVTVIGLNGGF